MQLLWPRANCAIILKHSRSGSPHIGDSANYSETRRHQSGLPNGQPNYFRLRLWSLETRPIPLLGHWTLSMGRFLGHPCARHDTFSQHPHDLSWGNSIASFEEVECETPQLGPETIRVELVSVADRAREWGSTWLARKLARFGSRAVLW
jgi:hypothetical protein